MAEYRSNSCINTLLQPNLMGTLEHGSEVRMAAQLFAELETYFEVLEAGQA
jgi:hypothetical protein